MVAIPKHEKEYSVSLRLAMIIQMLLYGVRVLDLPEA